MQLELSIRRWGPATVVTALACALTFAALLAQSTPLVSTSGETAGRQSSPGAPLLFVPNRGQHAANVLYEARDDRGIYAFGRRGVMIAVDQTTLELRFAGANPRATIQPGRREAGHVNYLVGPRARHRTRLPVYRGITYRGLWPGIDLSFLERDGRLRYEFYVRPGADPGNIRLAWRGAQGLSLTDSGALKVRTRAGAILDAPPRTFQSVGGRKRQVPSRYLLSGSTVGFAVGRYDRRRTLVIDPELSYSTYLGGLGTDQAKTVDVDGEGHAYVAGGTSSVDYPTTEGAFDRDLSDTANRSEAFVTKLEPDGTGLVWSTYIGGSRYESINSIVVDREGDAYIAGVTDSEDLPATPGAYDTTHNFGYGAAFAAKLAADGSRLIYSTFLGESHTNATGLAVDQDGVAYVLGSVCCTSRFPTTRGAYSRRLDESWIAKLDPSGAQLLQATYLGGDGYDEPRDIAIDQAGNAYVMGYSVSNIFPTTPGAFQSSRPGGGGDVFVSKLSPDLSRLEYSTWLGGTDSDHAAAIAVDRRGNAYVVGASDSRNFPTTPGAYKASTGSFDGFVTKLNATGSGLVYSTFFGGSSFGDSVSDVRVDSQGSAYVVGATSSVDFPTTPDAFQRVKPGQSDLSDAFLSKLDPTGSRLLASTFIGGQVGDGAGAVAIDAAGAAYVVGATRSNNFPTSAGAFDRTLAVPNPPPTTCCVIDSFAAKLLIRPGPPYSVTVAPETASNPVETSHCLTATVTDAYSTPFSGIAVRFSTEGAVSAAGTGQTDASGQARFCYEGPELPGSDRILVFADSDGSGDRAQGEPGAGARKAWVPPASSAGCKVTGHGLIMAENGDSARFTNSVRSVSASSSRGNVIYTDVGPAQPFRLRSNSIDALACEGRHATIFGTASLHEGPTAFRIDIEDRRRQADSYRILLGTGYDSGTQPVQRGNVRVKD